MSRSLPITPTGSCILPPPSSPKVVPGPRSPPKAGSTALRRILREGPLSFIHSTALPVSTRGVTGLFGPASLPSPLTCAATARSSNRWLCVGLTSWFCNRPTAPHDGWGWRRKLRTSRSPWYHYGAPGADSAGSSGAHGIRHGRSGCGCHCSLTLPAREPDVTSKLSRISSRGETANCMLKSSQRRRPCQVRRPPWPSRPWLRRPRSSPECAWARPRSSPAGVMECEEGAVGTHAPGPEYQP